MLEAVRKEVGLQFPILVRISADEFLEGGNTLEDTLKLLEFFQQEADIIDVSCGWWIPFSIRLMQTIWRTAGVPIWQRR